MDFFNRAFQRSLVFFAGVIILWFVLTQIYGRLDDQLPLVIAIFITYLISAYVILPRFIFLSVFLLNRGKIPRMTRDTGGLYADPVNIILSGTIVDLNNAFCMIGWNKADSLNLKNSWKMIQSIIFNRSYYNAPFSSLYLFGRKQDLGYQKNISKSPKKRHHVRFWAAKSAPTEELEDILFWFKKHNVDTLASQVWVGSASEDIGIGIKWLTYQITHRTNKDVDKERDYILGQLRKNGLIKNERIIDRFEEVGGKYLSDGNIIWAELKPYNAK
jgi:hypothetical protein